MSSSTEGNSGFIMQLIVGFWGLKLVVFCSWWSFLGCFFWRVWGLVEGAEMIRVMFP